MKRVLDDEQKEQQDDKAGAGMKKGGNGGNPRQNFQGEYDFLDVIDIADDKPGWARKAFREKVVENQACEQNQGKSKAVVVDAAAGIYPDFEYDAKYESVNCQHQ